MSSLLTYKIADERESYMVPMKPRKGNAKPTRVVHAMESDRGKIMLVDGEAVAMINRLAAINHRLMAIARDVASINPLHTDDMGNVLVGQGKATDMVLKAKGFIHE